MHYDIPSMIRASKSGDTIPSNFEIPMDCCSLVPLEAMEVEGQETRQKFRLEANSGVPMNLSGFYDPVIIDMQGVQFDKNVTAVIMDHDVAKRIGHTIEQVVIPAGATGVLDGVSYNGPLVAAVAVQSSDMGVAQGFVKDAKEGFPFQVSVGASIVPGFAAFVKEGETVYINGKDWNGPLIVAQKTKIRELTVTVLGADGNTSARLAAQHSLGKDQKMTFEAYLESLKLKASDLSEAALTAIKAQWSTEHGTSPKDPVTPVTVTPTVTATVVPDNATIEAQRIADRRIADVAEDDRQTAIKASASRFEGRIEKITFNGNEMTLEAARSHALSSGMSATDFELECHRTALPVPTGSPAIHVQQRDISGQALEASILRYFGTPQNRVNSVTGDKYGMEAMFDEKTLEASHERQYNFGGSIQALFEMQIRAAGGQYVGSVRTGSDFVAETIKAWDSVQSAGNIQAAFSTLNIVNVLENVMHKSALASFNAVESVWPALCGRKPANDFRAQNMYRLDFDGRFKQVAVDGELKHISMTDTKKTIQVDSYGAMVSVDRKTIRNDDLGMVVAKARGLGDLGAKRIEESVMVLLLSNPSSFFSAGNNNLITGAGTALSIAALETARQSFRNQVINGHPTAVSPQLLLVGTALETTARQLYVEEKIDPTRGANAFTNNPHKGLYTPLVTPYLNNTDITDQDGNAITGQTATQWYLAANPEAPQGPMIAISFLDGRETPYFDEAETQFNVPGGIQFRSYLDWGVAMVIEQMGLKSAGA